MHQTSEAEVPGSNPASPTMILMRCRIIVNNVQKSQGRERNLPLGQKKDIKKVDKFTLLDPDPHIECESGSRRENECGSGSRSTAL